MSLLIDGYNLMFAAGLIPRGIGPGTFARARRGLLNFLAHHLPEETLRRTVVVFDAKDAPPGRSAEQEFRGVRILFARDHGEADDLIEHLIRHDSSPRQLQVVSSDLRLRTAVRRRRAQAIKSEDWLDKIEQQSISKPTPTSVTQPEGYSWRQLAALSDDDVAVWLREFGLDSEPRPRREDQATSSTPVSHDVPSTTKEDDTPSTETHNSTDLPNESHGDWGPFPPGYGDDLLEDRDGAP